MQQAVYRFYRVGQCDDMSPSPGWVAAAKDAIAYVGRLEGYPVGVINGEMRTWDQFNEVVNRRRS